MQQACNPRREGGEVLLSQLPRSSHLAVPEVQKIHPQVQMHQLRFRGPLVIQMGSYVIRFKVLPSDASVDIEKVVDSVKKNLGSEAQLRGKSVEPIAFGISAAVLDIVPPEKEGGIETVERLRSSAALARQAVTVGLTGVWGRLPPRSPPGGGGEGGQTPDALRP